MVGIGASAGGLKAFEEFFSPMPADSGMVFVLEQHLAPDHECLLGEIMSRCTSMRVFEIEMPEQINCVYVIRPYRTQRPTKDGRVRKVAALATTQLNEAGEMDALATTERIIVGGTP